LSDTTSEDEDDVYFATYLAEKEAAKIAGSSGMNVGAARRHIRSNRHRNPGCPTKCTTSRSSSVPPKHPGHAGKSTSSRLPRASNADPCSSRDAHSKQQHADAPPAKPSTYDNRVPDLEMSIIPEAEVRAALTAAKAGGPCAIRKALKQLLLRWHPDKAPQNDSKEAAAARAESTRVLRFILDERERLNL